MARTLTDAFRRRAESLAGGEMPDHAALHAWSVREIEGFWDLVWDDSGVIGDKGPRVLADPDAMPGARFFPQGRINFARNLMRRHGSDDAVVFRAETGSTTRLSWDELRGQTAALAGFLRAADVQPGDVVAGFLPNHPAAIVGMLATASLGAIWTSCSPDFGVRGVVDRFGQTAPRVLIHADGYWYKGRAVDCRARVAEVLEQLPTVEQVIEVGYLGDAAEGIRNEATRCWDEVQTGHAGAVLEFTELPFNHPLYVLYSSGTTGPPKCIVHGAGGTLLKHLAEHRLMCDVRPTDRVFYFTTCGWMMWNWLASALASEATLLLFDGNPMHPSPDVLFEYAAAEGCTLFGTSAKYLDALAKLGVAPREDHDLAALRTITSTGSPLAPASFDYVYESIHPDVCLSSISGGTDIVGCFVGGDPTGPVWRGEIQAPSLGMAVAVMDESGTPLRHGKGELVCTHPFPSMPVGFWNDPDGARYHAAYFERFPGVWHHGDFAEFTDHGGVIIHGRSDATLNPGGVRIGTAEIYRVVERVDAVMEALVVGQDWDDDVRVILFVKLREGRALDDALQTELRQRIRTECSPRHVPARIVEVSDIPRTRSGKIVELAVKDVISGRTPRNLEALANPAALEQFRNRAELAD